MARPSFSTLSQVSSDDQRPDSIGDDPVPARNRPARPSSSAQSNGRRDSPSDDSSDVASSDADTGAVAVDVDDAAPAVVAPSAKQRPQKPPRVRNTPGRAATNGSRATTEPATVDDAPPIGPPVSSREVSPDEVERGEGRPSAQPTVTSTLLAPAPPPPDLDEVPDAELPVAGEEDDVVADRDAAPRPSRRHALVSLLQRLKEPLVAPAGSAAGVGLDESQTGEGDTADARVAAPPLLDPAARPSPPTIPHDVIAPPPPAPTAVPPPAPDGFRFVPSVPQPTRTVPGVASFSPTQPNYVDFDDPADEDDHRPAPAGQRTVRSTAAVGRRRPRVRRVTRVIRHVDPWSVFKVALCFSVVLYGVCLTAGVLLWNVAYTTGTIDNMERFFESFGWDTFEFKGGELYHNAWIAGLFAAVGLTGFIVLTVTLFNLITDLVGGVRVTVLEEEVVERDSAARRSVRNGRVAGVRAVPAAFDPDAPFDDIDDDHDHESLGAPVHIEATRNLLS